MYPLTVSSPIWQAPRLDMSGINGDHLSWFGSFQILLKHYNATHIQYFKDLIWLKPYWKICDGFQPMTPTCLWITIHLPAFLPALGISTMKPEVLTLLTVSRPRTAPALRASRHVPSDHQLQPVFGDLPHGPCEKCPAMTYGGRLKNWWFTTKKHIDTLT